MLACNDQEGRRHPELSRAMVFRLLARYKEDRRFSVLLPRPQGRKRGSHALLEGQERMISFQIQKVARTGENPSLSGPPSQDRHRLQKAPTSHSSYGTVLRRLRAYDARISRRTLERSIRSPLLFNGKQSLQVNGKNGMKLQKSTN
jgi:hypothetical protein